MGETSTYAVYWKHSSVIGWSGLWYINAIFSPVVQNIFQLMVVQVHYSCISFPLFLHLQHLCVLLSAWSRQCIWSFANLSVLKPQFSSFKVAIVTSILAREAKYSSLWDHYQNHCMKKPAGRGCEWVGFNAPFFFSKSKIHWRLILPWDHWCQVF